MLSYEFEAARAEERAEPPVEVGGNDVGDGAGRAAEERRLGFVGEELVEDADAPAGLEHARHLTDRRLRVRHDGEDEMEQRRVEGAVGEIERVGVHHADVGVEAEGVGAGLRLPHHRRREVPRDHAEAGREVLEVEARPAAGDEDALAWLEVERFDGASASAVETAGDEVVNGRVEPVADTVPGIRVRVHERAVR